jgi:2,3-dihydroxyphenylpropionate 1,2-dioxygenase
MTNAKLLCLSHTPLIGHLDPTEDRKRSALDAVGQLKLSLEQFDPQVIFLFAPDHYNGFFYDLMPPFCIGAQATAVGDWWGLAGALDVPRKTAMDCAEAVLAADVDVAFSYRMQVDHGFAQPLEFLAGKLDRYPVVPIFINSVAVPVPNFRRARLLGDAVGRFARGLGQRVAFIGSGGLSHNPPVPSLDTAPAEVAERLIAGRNPTPEARERRHRAVIAAAHDLVSGQSQQHPLNPEWDQAFLRTMVERRLETLDTVSNEEVAREGGNSAHEVKSWVAANAAMNACTEGRYQLSPPYYQAIPEWIAGFATLEGDALR